MNLETQNFADSLYTATSFDEAFGVLDREVKRLGFESILYTYIPGSLVQSNRADKPHYQVSSDYCPRYLSHYEEARFDRNDPLIKIVADGVRTPVEWNGDICESYKRKDPRSRQVIDVSHDYGIRHGLTIPLLSGERGIAGASLILTEQSDFRLLVKERLPQVQNVLSIYHNLVLADSVYLGKFIKPLFSSLSKLEMRYLAGLSRGRSQAEMAIELSRSEKYLEQVMLRIRRKVSGVDRLDKPTVSRNELFYYAGAVNLIRQAELL